MSTPKSPAWLQDNPGDDPHPELEQMIEEVNRPSSPPDAAMEGAIEFTERAYGNVRQHMQEFPRSGLTEEVARLASIIRSAIDKETEGLREGLKILVHAIAGAEPRHAGSSIIRTAQIDEGMYKIAVEALNRSKKP